jgi:hypothetical protein
MSYKHSSYRYVTSQRISETHVTWSLHTIVWRHLRMRCIATVHARTRRKHFHDPQYCWAAHGPERAHLGHRPAMPRLNPTQYNEAITSWIKTDIPPLILGKAEEFYFFLPAGWHAPSSTANFRSLHLYCKQQYKNYNIITKHFRLSADLLWATPKNAQHVTTQIWFGWNVIARIFDLIYIFLISFGVVGITFIYT